MKKNKNIAIMYVHSQLVQTILHHLYSFVTTKFKTTPFNTSEIYNTGYNYFVIS